LRADELRRPGIGVDQEDLGVGHRLGGGEQHVRPDEAGDEIDLVALHELLGLLLADLGLLVVILVDDLDRLAGHLAAHVVQGQLDRVAHVLADIGIAAGQGGDEADLDFALRIGRRNAEREHGRSGQKHRFQRH